MQSQQYIDLIKNIVSPVDKTGRFHKENIKYVIDLVYSQMLTQFSEDVIKNIDHFSKEYASQTVTLDGTSGLYYTDIPTPVVSIPTVASGIRYINTDNGMALDFVPTTEREQYYMDGLTTQLVDTNIGWWVKGDKIWYNESMTSAIAASGVRLVVIPMFSGFDATDTVNVPGGRSQELVERVLALIAPTAPVDLKANNA